MDHAYPGSVVPLLARFIEQRGIRLPASGYHLQLQKRRLRVLIWDPLPATTHQRHEFPFPWSDAVLFFIRTIHMEQYFVTGVKLHRNVCKSPSDGTYFSYQGSSAQMPVIKETLLRGLWCRRAAKVLRHVIPNELIPNVCQYIDIE